ncbi:MAG: glycosyltransferase family 4 protein, partial [Acidimicrobiales bacterium]
MSTPDGAARPEPIDLKALVAEAGFRRVHMLSWRDLEDVEAGGSEIHAANVASRWAEAGLDVTLRTSYAQGRAPIVTRDGYRVVRRAGRYLVFPRAVLSEITERHGAWDALVEIWNGMPFFSPVWRRGRPSIVFLHHVHAEMWKMVLPDNPRLARAGELLETRWAPLLYRRSRMVTLSESSRRELVDDLGFKPERVDVVPPGVDARFTPSGERSSYPLVVAVGRLVPVKRYDLLIECLVALKERHPTMQAVIAGEGYERPMMEARRAALAAEEWLQLPGRLSDEEVVDLYRRAWVLAGASAREGWGMTATEAGACGTPAVVTDVPGHRDAVVDGETGFLAADRSTMVERLDQVLSDPALRDRLGAAAHLRAKRFTWDQTAAGALKALVEEASRRKP